MEQMRRYGIPASVTLAQGIIESADGRSMLSRTANNHFGVKGEFNGQFVRADDDKPNEKFKKYDNVGQSYEDHSKVLMGDRYQKYTKNLSPDDYKGWAAGIKAGGYATSKNYVNTGGGKSVTVEYNRQDGSKYQATYMHLNSIDVKVGDIVSAGQQLGISGNTGTRTTGEHLHFQVKTIAADGTARDIDPAAYLAEIAQKGNIQVQALRNGKDLIAQYKVEGGQSVGTDNSNAIDTSMSPDDWMKKLLSSEDSGVGLGNSVDPIMDMAVTMFTSLMALAVQIDNKSEEDKMQAATDAAINKSIDLTSLLPNLKVCNIMLNDGKPLLQVNNGTVSFTHELTNAELTRIQQSLGNANLSDAEKQRSIASVINGIVVSQQMSQNYQQGVEAQQSQQESMQRK